MATSRCLASGGIVGVSPGPHKESIIVTVDGDGVSLYDAHTQVILRSWALGGAGTSFTAPTVYSKPLKRFFASLRESRGGGVVVRGWEAEAEDHFTSLTIKQSSNVIHLERAPPPIFLHPLPKIENGSDISDHTPCLLLAHEDGAVTLCNSVSVMSQELSLQGCPLLAAKGVGNVLYTVHKDRKSSAAVLLQKVSVSPSGVVTRMSLDALSPPVDSVHVVAAVCMVDRNTQVTPSVVVLWSDFSISGYLPWSIHAGVGLDTVSSSDTEPCDVLGSDPLFVRRLKGFVCFAATGQVNHNGTRGKSGATPRKKRGHDQSQTESSSVIGDVGLLNAGDGLVLVTGWSDESRGSLRLVSLDGTYGALLSAENIPFPSQNVDKTSKPIQGYVLPPNYNSRKIAMTVGGCALVTELKRIDRSTLATVVGSMSLPFSQALRSRASPFSVDSATLNGLNDTELESLKAPRVNVGTGLLELSSSASLTERSGKPTIVQPLPGLVWVKAKGKAEKVDPFIKLWTAYSRGDETREVKSLLDAVLNKHCENLSYDTVAMMLVCMAEHQLWDDILKLLQMHHPRSLISCGGVALAAVQAQRYDVMDALLRGAVDIEAWELAALLRELLHTSNRVNRRRDGVESPKMRHAQSVRQKAVLIVEDAEKKKGDISLAACCAAAVDGFSAAQICLHPLLTMNYESSVLLDALKQLQSPLLATRLLQYLTIWLRNYRCIVGEHHALINDSPLPLPGLKIVVEWLSLTIDVNLSSFMLRRESDPVLLSLQEEVAFHVKASKRFLAMKGPLDHLQRGAPLSFTQRSAGVLGQRYAMEWLSLKVGR